MESLPPRQAGVQSGGCFYYQEEALRDSFVMMLIPISCFPISLPAQMLELRALLFPEIMPSCLFNYQAERLKEQASCWEKEEREGYMSHASRQPLTKVHCKVPYRTYERRSAMSWSRRVQRSPEVSDDADDDEDEEDSDASDGAPPILTKAHAMLATKRKVSCVVVVDVNTCF